MNVNIRARDLATDLLVVAVHPELVVDTTLLDIVWGVLNALESRRDKLPGRKQAPSARRRRGTEASGE